MLAITAESQDKGFTSINSSFVRVAVHCLMSTRFISKTLHGVIISSWVFILSSCDNEKIDKKIPFVPFSDIIIHLKSQQYLALHNRGYMTIDGGLRGIILYKKTFEDQYTAYERNCSYQPNDACALVEVAASGLSMQDKCCSSTFEFSRGYPTGGPAKNSLRRYKTFRDGDILTITDEPLN